MPTTRAARLREIDAKLLECSTVRSTDPQADVSALVAEVLTLSEEHKDAQRLATLDRLYRWVTHDQLESAKRFYVPSTGPHRTAQQEKNDLCLIDLTNHLTADSQVKSGLHFWFKNNRSAYFNWAREKHRMDEANESENQVLFEGCLLALTLCKKIEESVSRVSDWVATQAVPITDTDPDDEAS